MSESRMTTRLNSMNKQLEEVVEGYHRFLLKYPKYKDQPICFVEGEDEAYYGLRVKMHCENKEPYFIRCNGKRGVIQTFNKIQSTNKYNTSKLLYFVDRDFDKLMNNPLIYETPCYSIENLYTTLDTYIRILRNKFNITEDDEEFETCVSLFKERQKEFHDCILLLNCWIICIKEQIEQTNAKDGPRISSLKLNDFVVVNLNSVRAIYDLKKIEEKFSGKYTVPKEIIDSKIKELQNINSQQFFRGKFEIEFLRKFLMKLQEELASPRQGYFSKPKSVSGNFDDIVSGFAQYADTPSCLIEYIKRIWFGISTVGV
jgi:hypothetical protein